MGFASLKYDYAFRELFSHESIRKQFISDVTGIPLESILEARLASPFLWKRYHRQKQGILDVAVRLQDGTRVDIEMQVKEQKYWVKRNLFYLAKMYTEGLRSGEEYERLRKCIVISVLDFKLTEGEQYHSVYRLRDENGEELTDLLEVHIIELKKELRGTGAVEDWIRLFNAESLEDLDMIKTTNAGILEAIEVVRSMGLSRRLRLLYEERQKARRDRWAEDEFVRDQGRAEGVAIGKAEGKAEGMAIGKAEDILLILSAKGEIDGDIRKKILAEADTDVLNEWVRTAALAKNLEEFRRRCEL